jgi:soluble lytic murein transglycosylase
MRSFLIISLIALFSCFSFAQETNSYIKQIEQKKWTQAQQNKSSNLRVLAMWLKLTQEPNPDFYELSYFVKNFSSWPKQDLLKYKIEINPCNNCKEIDLINWFKANPPKTILGKKKYIAILKDQKLKNEYIKSTWEEAIFSKSEEDKFLKAHHGSITKADHIKRINYMLFNHHIDQATRLLALLPPNLRPLYETRIKLQKGDSKALASYQNLDKLLQNDIGILHNLAHMYEAQKNEEKLIETLNLASNIGGNYQLYFWNMKAKLIRPLLLEKNYQTAYLLSSSHGHLNTKEYSEAEWLSGWIALRFLNKAELAINHFTNVYNKVKLPVSKARASYWLGRSYEALKDSKQSQYWYGIAAQKYIAFYGQLAACKIHNCQVNLPKEPLISTQSQASFNNNHLVKAALILEKTKYQHLVQELLFKAIENSSDLGEIALITKIGFQLEKTHLSVESAKQASYKDVHIIDSNYPVLKNIHREHELDESLVMALIRQESVFNHG